MIKIKTPSEIDQMAESGKILREVMQKVLAKAAAGMTTKELDGYAEKLIKEKGATPSFKMEKNYRYTTCMCVNDMVVHGIPTNYELRTNDYLGVDCGVFYRGWHADASWSILIGGKPDKFLQTGQRALELAIDQCVPGKHIGDISKTMEEVIRQGGYSPVKALVGHGIGRELHEDPEIPCYQRGKIENTDLIKPGMVLAVEVIYNRGDSPVVYGGDDGWTIVTRDGSPSGLFEHTVAVTETGPRVLT